MINMTNQTITFDKIKAGTKVKVKHRLFGIMEIEVLEMKSGGEMIKYFKGIRFNISLNKDFKILEILNN
jgi:hypothetical protein